MKRYRKPEAVKDLREHGRVILAHGEVTGHHHEVIGATDVQGPGEIDIPAAEFFEEPDGRRVLLAHRVCVLTHQEHGRIALVPADAARGARGELDATGRLVGQYRQGDVLLQPIGYGIWEVRRQSEHQPEAIRPVVD